MEMMPLASVLRLPFPENLASGATSGSSSAPAGAAAGAASLPRGPRAILLFAKYFAKVVFACSRSSMAFWSSSLDARNFWFSATRCSSMSPISVVNGGNLLDRPCLVGLLGLHERLQLGDFRLVILDL